MLSCCCCCCASLLRTQWHTSHYPCSFTAGALPHVKIRGCVLCRCQTRRLLVVQRLLLRRRCQGFDVLLGRYGPHCGPPPKLAMSCAFQSYTISALCAALHSLCVASPHRTHTTLPSQLLCVHPPVRPYLLFQRSCSQTRWCYGAQRSQRPQRSHRPHHRHGSCSTRSAVCTCRGWRSISMKPTPSSCRVAR